ncbi:MAG: ABC transporter ATP-binding protein [Ignavibacteria bacterium]|nr:ABC transporter ATP-binding protein [Ignavibacteria bacterium]
MKTYLRILSYLKKYKLYLFISVILSIFFSIFSALSIYLTIPLLKTLFFGGESTISTQTDLTGLYSRLQYTFESFIFSEGKLAALYKVCILILISFILKNITGFYQSLYMQYSEKGLMRDLRISLYEKINKLSLRYFTSERTGNLISRMTSDLNTVQSGISAAFFNLTKDPLLILIFLVLAISISLQLTLMSIVVFPVTIFAIVKIGSSLRRRSQRVQEKMSDIISIITETIYGAKIIRAFRAEKYRNDIFQNESEAHYKLTIKTVKTNELTSPITEVLSIVAGVFIIWFGGNEILVNQNLQPEEFLGFLFILFQLMTPIKNLSTVNNRIQESIASGNRIFEILDYPEEIKISDNPIELNDFKENIQIENVGFYYSPEKIVLQDINFEIKKSEVIAIVGSSGVGKSTLADLIARFYDVTSGRITIDGIDIKDIKIESVRHLVGIVPQETILFNDTIRNNILFGSEGISDEKLIEITKYANSYDFILETEKGFDTVIGERGLRLSGGQKQRLSIARALIRNPQILILDEATSSLDSESEILVQDALDKLMTNRTSLVIAHRLSTVLNADKIIVLSEGKIIQSGTHNELIKAESGVYKKLYDLQFLNNNS